MEPDTYAALLAELTAMGKAPTNDSERHLIRRPKSYAWAYVNADDVVWASDFEAELAIRIAAEDVLLDHGWLIYMRGDGLYVATPASGFYLSDDFTGPTIEEALLAALQKIKEPTRDP